MSDVETPVVAPVEILDKPEAVAATNVDFLSLISDEYKSTSNIKDFKDANQMAKSYIELQKMVGGSVRIPPKDASPESKTEFFNKIKDIDGILLKDDAELFSKLGRPSKPEEYKLDNHLSEDYKAALKPELDSFKNIAYNLGLSDAQAKGLLDMRMGELEAQQQSFIAEQGKTKDKLQKLWGEDFDNRLAGVKQVREILKDKFSAEIEALINSPAGNNPALLHVFSELAATYKENGHVGMQSVELGTTPEMARDKIAEKRRDVGFMEAYNNFKHPGHAKAVATIEDLYRKL